MQKVLYIVSTLKKAGPTNQLFNIIQHLDRNNFDPMVLTLSQEPKETNIQKFRDAGIKVESLNMSRLKGLFDSPRLVKKFIETHKPDIIHTQGIRSDLLSANHLSKYKRVATLRNYPFEDYPMTYGPLLGYPMALLHLNALRKINFPTACSNSIANMMKKHNLKFNIVQNGVDTNVFSASTISEKKILREKHGLPLDKIIFVSVGHLSSRKDPITLIKAFNDSSYLKDHLLIFLGEGPLKEECQELIRNNDSIKLLGRRNDIDELLKCSDFFVSASLSEGLPNSVLEALASGVPVCLSNIEQHQEILSYNSNAGELFSVGNVSELHQKIKLLLDKDHTDLVNSGLEIIENHLSASKMSQKYQNIYNS